MSEETQTPTIEELQAEFEAIKQQADASLAGWQRAQADYANLKKEMEKRQEETVSFANAAFMANVLPIYNHFKLALRHIPADQQEVDWVKGLGYIEKQFQDFLKKYSIIEIKTVGEQFNPHYHEAITHEEKEGFETDVVFEEVMPGYMLGEVVLNPAKVKVAK